MSVLKGTIAFLLLTSVFSPGLLLAENLSIEIRTAIEEPDCQAGMKSTHTIKVDTKTRNVDDGQYSTGTTNIMGCDFGSINDSFKIVGHYQTAESFRFKAVGKTATIVTLGLGPSIDYEFTFEVNTKDKTVTLSGDHDGYPTFYVKINDKLIYNFDQTSLTKLAEPLDIKVPSKVVSYQK